MLDILDFLDGVRTTDGESVNLETIEFSNEDRKDPSPSRETRQSENANNVNDALNRDSKTQLEMRNPSTAEQIRQRETAAEAEAAKFS